MTIYPIWKTQIALLLAKNMAIPTEYLDYIDVFSKKLAVELLERFDINKHLIDLELIPFPTDRRIVQLIKLG